MHKVGLDSPMGAGRGTVGVSLIVLPILSFVLPSFAHGETRQSTVLYACATTTTHAILI